MFEKSYDGIKAYLQTKLANVLFTKGLSRRLVTANVLNVTVNAFHPGIVRTRLGSGTSPFWMTALVGLAKPFLLSPDQGAETGIYLASAPEAEGPSGGYFRKKRPVSVAKNPQADDAVLAQRLWASSEALLHEPFQL